MVVEVRGEKYYMEPTLKDNWDKIKDGGLAKYDEDRVYITDGREGTGKSVFTLQQAAYIDPTILDDEGDTPMPRICFTSYQFLNAIKNTKSTPTHTKAVIFDEAFRGLSSKAALSKVNKQIVQAMMEMRQHNIIVFINSPSFFLLELYPAMLRSSSLFHVVKDKQNPRKRYVRIFNYRKKAKLYQAGIRKGWGYNIHTNLRARFFNKYPGGKEFEARYRKQKDIMSKESEDEGKQEVDSRFKVQRDILINHLAEKEKLKADKMAEFLGTLGIEISGRQVHRVFKEKEEKLSPDPDKPI